MSLFEQVTLGASVLKHRIVLAPILQKHGDDELAKYFNEVQPEGGLVITPNVLTRASTSTQRQALAALHDKGAVVFAEVLQKDGSTADLSTRLISLAKQALEIGYDGVEINAGTGSTLGKMLHGSVESSIFEVVDVVRRVAEAVPAAKLGVRLCPFDIVDGHHFTDPAVSLEPLLTLAGTELASLAFVRVSAHKRFDDFEFPATQSLDAFRTAVINGGRKTLFISENAYDAEAAWAVASSTADLIAVGLPSDANPALIPSARDSSTTGYDLAIPADTQARLRTIRDVFEGGKEYVVPWSSEQQQAGVESAMSDLGAYLSSLDPSLSYEGTDKKVVWRKSCWFASEGIGRPFLDSEEDIARFDGDLADGLAGLRALREDGGVRASMELLKAVLDGALVTTARAVGVDPRLALRCTARYRVIKYTPHAGAPGGIGLHPDGNLLSALITNGGGLRVYDLDGTVRRPGHDGTIMMGGSTLYRWSAGRYPPTFHDVDIRGEQVKVSIVCFFNFPDMETIPRDPASIGSEEEQRQELGEDVTGFFHDIRRIKEDDKLPEGELSRLWDVIIEKHKLVLPPSAPQIAV